MGFTWQVGLSFFTNSNCPSDAFFKVFMITPTKENEEGSGRDDVQQLPCHRAVGLCIASGTSERVAERRYGRERARTID